MSPSGIVPHIGSNVTIACQTAPGDGVLIKAELKFRSTQNIIMRYCRIRPGDVPDTSSATTNAVLGHDSTAGSVTTPYYAIFDHVSMGTTNDDTFGFYAPGPEHAYFTIQHSIMSEGTVHNAVSAGATFGVGFSGGQFGHASWLHNLIHRLLQTVSGRGWGNPICEQHLSVDWWRGDVCRGPRYGPVEWNVVNNSFRTVSTNQT